MGSPCLFTRQRALKMGYFTDCIKRDFLKHKTIKVRDNKLNRRFGVDITPLSR